MLFKLFIKKQNYCYEVIEIECFCDFFPLNSFSKSQVKVSNELKTKEFWGEAYINIKNGVNDHLYMKNLINTKST